MSKQVVEDGAAPDERGDVRAGDLPDVLSEVEEERMPLVRILAIAAAFVGVGAFGARTLISGVLDDGSDSEWSESALGADAELPERTWLQAFGDRQARSYLDANPEALEPVAEQSEPVDFEVFAGEAVASIAERLAALGIVRDAEATEALARLRGLDTRIQAGIHTVRADRSTADNLDALLVAAGDEVVVTLREGWRSEEIADALEAIGLVEREAFLALVTAGVTDVALAADRPVSATLEGYLFPDTYRFEPEAGAETVLARLVETFAARAPADFAATATALELSTYEAVTLASIIEREAAVAAERPRIARVFLNRLAEPPYLLNADPTLQYALGFQPETESWWKRPLLTVDLQIDSPYNSYTTPGLPPSPIANPGLASLEAVIEPEAGEWNYFVADEIACDGTHVFAVTYEEHLANVERYRTGECGQ